MKMFIFIFNKTPKPIWKIIAIVIVVIAAPDIIIGMEFMAFANLLGVDFFVLMYLSGLLVYLQPLINGLQKFWNSYFSGYKNTTIG